MLQSWPCLTCIGCSFSTLLSMWFLLVELLGFFIPLSEFPCKVWCDHPLLNPTRCLTFWQLFPGAILCAEKGSVPPTYSPACLEQWCNLGSKKNHSKINHNRYAFTRHSNWGVPDQQYVAQKPLPFNPLSILKPAITISLLLQIVHENCVHHLSSKHILGNTWVT